MSQTGFMRFTPLFSYQRLKPVIVKKWRYNVSYFNAAAINTRWLFTSMDRWPVSNPVSDVRFCQALNERVMNSETLEFINRTVAMFQNIVISLHRQHFAWSIMVAWSCCLLRYLFSITYIFCRKESHNALLPARQKNKKNKNVRWN